MVGLPPKREALRWLDGLDHTAAGAAWASRTVPGKNNFSAWTQIDACLRAEPGTELVRLRESRPDPRGWRGEDDLTFDRVGDVHRNLCLGRRPPTFRGILHVLGRLPRQTWNRSSADCVMCPKRLVGRT